MVRRLQVWIVQRKNKVEKEGLQKSAVVLFYVKISFLIAFWRIIKYNKVNDKIRIKY